MATVKSLARLVVLTLVFASVTARSVDRWSELWPDLFPGDEVTKPAPKCTEDLLRTMCGRCTADGLTCSIDLPNCMWTCHSGDPNLATSLA